MGQGAGHRGEGPRPGTGRASGQIQGRDRTVAAWTPSAPGLWRLTHMPKECFIGTHIYARTGILTHNFLNLAGEHREVFSIVLVGNQIDALMFVKGVG
jgi:hypothetical protein